MNKPSSDLSDDKKKADDDIPIPQDSSSSVLSMNPNLPERGAVVPLPSSTNDNVILIREVQTSDILFGRGRPYQNHPGNQRMRDLVDSYQEEYRNAPRRTKSLIAQSILNQLVADGKARFLKRYDAVDNEEDDVDVGKPTWVQVDHSEAREKISHAFRNRDKLDEKIQARREKRKRKRPPAAHQELPVQQQQVQQLAMPAARSRLASERLAPLPGAHSAHPTASSMAAQLLAAQGLRAAAPAGDSTTMLDALGLQSLLQQQQLREEELRRMAFGREALLLQQQSEDYRRLALLQELSRSNPPTLPQSRHPNMLVGGNDPYAAALTAGLHSSNLSPFFQRSAMLDAASVAGRAAAAAGPSSSATLGLSDTDLLHLMSLQQQQQRGGGSATSLRHPAANMMIASAPNSSDIHVVSSHSHASTRHEETKQQQQQQQALSAGEEIGKESPKKPQSTKEQDDRES